MQSFGLLPKKSLILQYPPNNTITKELFPHFLRGLFDGDGCITGPFYKNPNDRNISFFIVSASQPFLLSLQNKILEYLKITSYVRMSKKPNVAKGWAALYNLMISDRRSLDSLYNFLYKDAHYYLKRKRKRFDDYMLAKNFYKLPLLQA